MAKTKDAIEKREGKVSRQPTAPPEAKSVSQPPTAELSDNELDQAVGGYLPLKNTNSPF
jgi:hypothetical protein